MDSTRTKRSARTRVLLKAGVIPALALVILGGARLWQGEPPTGGAVLTFASTIPDRRVEISHARDQAGRPFSHAGSFHHSDTPMNGGATMGSAPGTFGLPSWVEFTWQELPYPSPPRDSFATDEAWGNYVDNRYRAAPMKTARVNVAEKIPVAVLEEVARSRAATPLEERPDKMLWLYFIWTTDGIKVRWRVNSRSDIRQDSEAGDTL